MIHSFLQSLTTQGKKKHGDKKEKKKDVQYKWTIIKCDVNMSSQNIYGTVFVYKKRKQVWSIEWCFHGTISTIFFLLN